MVTESKNIRTRTMSLQQRLICEFFAKHPNSTRAECSVAVHIRVEGVREKVASLIKSGHLVIDASKFPATFSLTGKAFPSSADYQPCQKWVAQRIREDARVEHRVAVLDLVSAAFHAMVSTGRATA